MRLYTEIKSYRRRLDYANIADCNKHNEKPEYKWMTRYLYTSELRLYTHCTLTVFRWSTNIAVTFSKYEILFRQNDEVKIQRGEILKISGGLYKVAEAYIK